MRTFNSNDIQMQVFTSKEGTSSWASSPAIEHDGHERKVTEFIFSMLTRNCFLQSHIIFFND